MSQNQVAMLKVKDIRDNPAALRTVDLESDKFKGIVASVKVHGILNSISVRVVRDELEDVDVYQLVDGLHRLTAARIAIPDGDIPCTILTCDECDALASQIVGNLMKVDTKPVQYTEQLLRILAARPALTPADLATMTGETVEWIEARLSLKNLDPALKPLVDEGDIKVTNAIALARLPAAEQLEWADKAASTAPAEFQPAVSKRLGEIRKAAREGRPVGPPTFAPTARVRKMIELKAAAEGQLDQGPLFGDPAKASVAREAVNWVLSLDPETVAEAKAEWERKQAAKTREKLTKSAETARKKLADAEKSASEVRARLIAAGIPVDTANLADSQAAS